MNIHRLMRKSQKFVNDNSPTILTGVGVAGTLVTAYLTGRAAFKAADVLKTVQAKRYHSRPDNSNREEYELDVKEKFKLTWTLYLPSVATAAVTVTSICMARKIDGARLTALVGAYAISEKAFDDYKEKVVEKLGESKATKIHDEIVQDKMKNTEVPPNLVIVPDQKVLCMDTYSGRFFHSTMQDIRRAENDAAYEINHALYFSLSSFYDLLNLSHTEVSDNVGWTSDNPFTLTYTSGLDPQGNPCLAFSFDSKPFPI